MLVGGYGRCAKAYVGAHYYLPGAKSENSDRFVMLRRDYRQTVSAKSWRCVGDFSRGHSLTRF